MKISLSNTIGIYRKPKNGWNSAQVRLLKKSTSQPSAYAGSEVTYTFATGAVLFASGNDGWSVTPPSGDGDLYAIFASAATQENSDTIQPNEWTAPVVLSEEAVAGQDGYNVCTVFIYQRGESAPSLPSATVTYTFEGGAISGLSNGWTKNIPDGEITIWVSSATAFSRTSSDTILASEWSEARIFAKKGDQGKKGEDAVQVNVISTTGSAFRETDASLSGVITAQVMQGMNDITATIEDFRFSWKRISASENPADDESWNTSSKAIGHKYINITNNDCIGRTVFICEVDIQGE